MSRAHHPFRSLLVTLLILILLGGVVFYFGWIQIKIKPDTCAVVFTKTGGWDPEPLRPGKFIWRWEKLIPGNMTIYSFTVLPRNSITRVEGTLPSSEIYAALLDHPIGFSYSVEVSITYSLNPEQLPLLASEKGVRPDTIDSWYSQIESLITSEISAFMESRTTVIESGKPFPDMRSLGQEMAAVLKTRIPEIDFLSVTPRGVSLPDMALYETLRANYAEILDARNKALVELAAQAVVKEGTQSDRLRTLREYGELLTTYPVLLDYLALEMKGAAGSGQ